MIKLIIDGIGAEVEEGTSVLRACERLGIEIPHFCYHEKLGVAGSCRMCLVEIEGMSKLVTSCTQPCAEGMVVHTNSPRVREARRDVMELTLANHPLDCPVCDKGGECALQDLAVAYGHGHGRYEDKKRAVTEKDLGPLIKTNMTRCIHCTRCIRFLEEVCGTPEMGGIGRGEGMEITVLTRALASEMQGNLIDICPTGALTSKPGAYAGRSWEYGKTETIDVSDAVGSNVRVDARGDEIVRVVPRSNDAVNETWIGDKARFAFDGLKKGRLDRPYVKRDGKLVEATWDEAFAAIAEKARATPPSHIAALAGDLADCESMFALKCLMEALGSPNMDCRQDGAVYDTSTRAAYIMNTGVAGLEQADAILLIGTDPRREAGVINARIRKRWLKGGCRIGLIGAPVDLGYPYEYLGNTPQPVSDLMADEGAFAVVLKSAKRPAFILGAGALARADGAALHRKVRVLAEYYKAVREDWNGFNVLQNAASRVGGLDLGFLPQKGGFGTKGILGGKAEMIWLLGADECDLGTLASSFVVYQGHHGDKGARAADVILPGAAYTEKAGTYVNAEGRVQTAGRAVSPPGDAREDWKIVRAFAESFGGTLPFDTFAQLRESMTMSAPVLGSDGMSKKEAWASFGFSGEVTNVPFTSTIENYYMTDPICRASGTMARCVEEILPLAKEVAR